MPFPKSAMEYVPLHSLRVQLYYMFYSIALFVFAINRIRQNASHTLPNSAVASLNGTFHLSPNENILTIARINIHYLYNGGQESE
jgi:hypothetical protein